MLQNEQPERFILPAEQSFKRIQVYRNNFMQGHVSALKHVYKLTALYLGAVFETLAVQYVCENRPLHGTTLSEYGEGFGVYLPDEWLQDLAKLEWAMYRVSIARLDVPAVNELVEPIYWSIRHDVELLALRFDVVGISNDIEAGIAPKKTDAAELFYAVFRAGEEQKVNCMPLDKDGFELLHALQLSSFTIDELFDKLTICQDKFITLIQSIFIKDLVKGKNVSNFETSKECAAL